MPLLSMCPIYLLKLYFTDVTDFLVPMDNAFICLRRTEGSVWEGCPGNFTNQDI